MIRIWYYLWASPNTALGLAVAAVSPNRELRDGVLEVHGGLATWVCRHALIEGGASAMTLGHVVIGRDAASLDSARDHEQVHVRQYERWGPLFLPAYAACSAWMWARGRDAYRDNPFEVEAYRDG